MSARRTVRHTIPINPIEIQEIDLSTITDVALTAAVAGTPGAKPSSSTASRVTAATIRCGPASISTSAITPSTSTERTTPGNRLRALKAWPVAGRRGCGESRSTSSLRHEPPVALVADRVQLAGAVPAPQRVRAHAERARRLAERQPVHGSTPSTRCAPSGVSSTFQIGASAFSAVDQRAGTRERLAAVGSRRGDDHRRLAERDAADPVDQRDRRQTVLLGLLRADRAQLLARHLDVRLIVERLDLARDAFERDHRAGARVPHGGRRPPRCRAAPRSRRRAAPRRSRR